MKKYLAIILALLMALSMLSFGAAEEAWQGSTMGFAGVSRAKLPSP